MSLSTSPVRSVSQALAQFILRLMGWKLQVELPDVPKYIVVGAPHTSNWDFVFTLLLMYGAGLTIYWIGKDSLFRPPFGALMRWLGGIPVVRDSRNDFVSQIVKLYRSRSELIIAISPEGTRSRTDYWKTGFYYIAQGAGIPIALGYVDFSKKQLGIGLSFYPSGDIQADFVKIKEFYADKRGKNSLLQGQIQLRDDAVGSEKGKEE